MNRAEAFFKQIRALEKKLGLGGKKTDRFLESLSEALAPALENLESVVLKTQSLPFGMLRGIFEHHIAHAAREAGITARDLKESVEAAAALLREWFQPGLFWEQGMILANTLFGRGPLEKTYDEFGMDHELVDAVRPFFQFLYDDYWRVDVRGLSHIPKNGRCLLVGNHSGMLPYDGSMITTAVMNGRKGKRHVRFLIEDFVYHFPFLGTFMNRLGAVRACPENAVRLLKKGEIVLVFPEGVKGLGKIYSERYRLKRFGRGGFIKLALKTRTPIVPVAVIGAEEIHPILWKSSILAKAMGVPYLPATPTFPWLGPLGLIPLPTKWSLRFGKPIPLKGYKPADADNGLLVQKLSEKVRDEIQKMLKEGLRQRKSVWLG